jgi:hypothetical protein
MLPGEYIQYMEQLCLIMLIDGYNNKICLTRCSSSGERAEEGNAKAKGKKGREREKQREEKKLGKKVWEDKT